MRDDKSLSEVYRRVIQYGFAKIEQVPPTESDTKDVLERVCRMSHTVFGSLWETGTHFDHKDTGYLNGYLEAHTDTTYFTEAQGYVHTSIRHYAILQLFMIWSYLSSTVSASIKGSWFFTAPTSKGLVVSHSL